MRSSHVKRARLCSQGNPDPLGGTTVQAIIMLFKGSEGLYAHCTVVSRLAAGEISEWNRHLRALDEAGAAGERASRLGVHGVVGCRDGGAGCVSRARCA